MIPPNFDTLMSRLDELGKRAEDSGRRMEGFKNASNPPERGRWEFEWLVRLEDAVTVQKMLLELKELKDAAD